MYNLVHACICLASNNLVHAYICLAFNLYSPDEVKTAEIIFHLLKIKSFDFHLKCILFLNWKLSKLEDSW